MILNRRGALGLAALAATPASDRALTPVSQLAPPDPTESIRLWPNGAPGGERVTVTPRIVERSTDPAFHDRYAQYTTDPLLSVVRPQRPNGASLLLIPGGGYRWAVIDKEGLDCARLFAAAGVTCFVLRYRLPADGWAAGPDAPLQDAQRAMALIRQRAAADGLDPNRIAVLGASAGGHLAGTLVSRTDDVSGDGPPVPPRVSIVLYPVVTLTAPHAHAGSRLHLLGETPSAGTIARHSLEQADWSGDAPMFLLHAMDDATVPVENSLRLLEARRAAGALTEAHLFEEGGHGFGIRLIAGKPAAVWPSLVLAWGERHGWLQAGAAPVSAAGIKP